jgi:hypothetical protein
MVVAFKSATCLLLTSHCDACSYVYDNTQLESVAGFLEDAKTSATAIEACEPPVSLKVIGRELAVLSDDDSICKCTKLIALVLMTSDCYSASYAWQDHVAFSNRCTVVRHSNV